jgi:hypothetical protein
LVLAQVGQTGMAWVPCGRPPWLLPVPPWLLATPPWLLATPPVGLGTAPEGLSTPPEGLSTPPGLLATPPWRLDSAPGQLESAPELLPNRTVVLSGAPEGLSSQPGQLDSVPEVFAGAQAAVAVVSYHRDTKPGRYPWRREVRGVRAPGACRVRASAHRLRSDAPLSGLDLPCFLRMLARGIAGRSRPHEHVGASALTACAPASAQRPHAKAPTGAPKK